MSAFPGTSVPVRTSYCARDARVPPTLVWDGIRDARLLEEFRVQRPGLIGGRILLGSVDYALSSSALRDMQVGALPSPRGPSPRGLLEILFFEVEN